MIRFIKTFKITFEIDLLLSITNVIMTSSKMPFLMRRWCL